MLSCLSTVIALQNVPTSDYERAKFTTNLLLEEEFYPNPASFKELNTFKEKQCSPADYKVLINKTYLPKRIFWFWK